MSNEDFKTLPLETLAELLTDIADGLTTREYTRLLKMFWTTWTPAE
jgi:hypothetical protein